LGPSLDIHLLYPERLGFGDVSRQKSAAPSPPRSDGVSAAGRVVAGAGPAGKQWLWRIHRTHHSDLDYDFTTGLRFHPFEALMTLLIVMAAIALIGAPPVAVVIAELLTTTIGLTEHSNVRLPPALDRALRLIVVTPDLHRVHHSRDAGDTNHSLATVFTFWDRLFGTYREYPSNATADLAVGLAEFDDRKHLRLDWMLAQPFLTERIERPDAPAAARVTVRK
jgi:hypothetical protein